MTSIPAYTVAVTFEAREGLARWLTYATHTLEEARQIWLLIEAAADLTGEWVWAQITHLGEPVERLDSLGAQS